MSELADSASVPPGDMESCFFCGKEVTSRAQKKRRRVLSGPQLDILKKLSSEFLEVDCSMLHTGYACRSCYDRVQTLTENLKNALPIRPKLLSSHSVQQVETEASHSRSLPTAVTRLPTAVTRLPTAAASSPGSSPHLAVSLFT